ncbi:MAG: CBS domain-containing protein, partial [Terracoccus sp.]
RSAPVASVATPAHRVDVELSLLDALSVMRAERAQLVFVVDATGPVGLVSMEDLLERVLGQFDDETDT